MRKIVLSILLFYVHLISSQAQIGRWTELDTVYNYSRSYALDSSDNLYAVRGDNNGNPYIARWTGSNWAELGSGTNKLNANGYIYAISADKYGNIYTCGAFTDVNKNCYVAKWNGISWSELGAGNAFIYGDTPLTCMDINDSGYVYCGVKTAVPQVLKWNGSNWENLGMLNKSLDTIKNFETSLELTTIVADDSGHVFVGEEGIYVFSVSEDNGPSLASVDGANWNGNQWGDVYIGYEFQGANFIEALEKDRHGNIYAGGVFTNASGYNYVAKWDGKSWSELGSLNANGFILGISVVTLGNVYACGRFTNADGYNYVAKWDGNTWSELGTGTGALHANGDIYSVVADNSGNVYTSGYFTNAAGKYYIARWNPKDSTLSTLDPLISTNLSIYPNPSKGIIHISDLPENVQMDVYNVLGQTVSTQQLSKGDSYMDLSNLTSGIYNLVFTGHHNSYTPAKWVKE